MPEPEPARDFYGADLARIHAEAYAPAFDRAADWFAELARRPAAPPFVFDLGCGDGRMLAALAARGVPGAGVDLSPAFVALARGRGLDVRQGDAAAAAIPSATLVVALGEALCYEDARGGIALHAAVRAAFAALVPGGALVFDVTGPDVPESAAWREGEGWLVASSTRAREGRLVRRIVTFARDGAGWRRSDEIHAQRLLTRGEVLGAIRAAGFTAGPLARYGEAPLLSGRLAFLCVKPR
jgi:SAM-dependent methyltransferase